MKSLAAYFIVIFLFVTLGRVMAQLSVMTDKNLNGIYLSHDDFLTDLLLEPSQSDADVLEELREGAIKLVRSGKTSIFKFGSFYAYRNNGYCYVSFGKKELLHNYGYYKILDCTGLIIYNQRVPHPLWIYVEEPYFSTDLDSKKYPLDIHHLKKHVHLTHAVVKELRWFKKQTGSLAQMVNNRSIVNILLAAEQ